MAKFKVIAVVTLYAGTIGLNKAQAEPRMHCLQPAEKGKNLYDIVEPVSFKVGEVIDIPGVPDKALAQRLEPVGKAAEKLMASTDEPPPKKDEEPPAGGAPTDGNATTDDTASEDGATTEGETNGQ